MDQFIAKPLAYNLAANAGINVLLGIEFTDASVHSASRRK
jgi:hypothetical protein